jgi:hypothetical protein
MRGPSIEHLAQGGEMMSRKGIVGFGLLVMIVGSACGLSSLGGAPDGATPGTGAATAAGGSPGTPAPPEAAVLPVSINEGLASLDSYRMTYINDIYDSLGQERTVTTFIVARDRDTDASYNRTETLVTSGDGEVVSEDVEEQFAIGHQVCVFSEGAGEITTISDTAQVMSDLMSQVFVIQPLIENPVFVAEDVVSGVPVRTYTFEVRSIDAASDVEVARSDGSYAIAVDGDYLLRYRLDLELRTGAEGDPEAESSVSSFDLLLEEINQPVEITFPETCQLADSIEE